MDVSLVVWSITFPTASDARILCRDSTPGAAWGVTVLRERHGERRDTFKLDAPSCFSRRRNPT